MEMTENTRIFNSSRERMNALSIWNSKELETSANLTETYYVDGQPKQRISNRNAYMELHEERQHRIDYERGIYLTGDLYAPQWEQLSESERRDIRESNKAHRERLGSVSISFIP